MQTVKLPVKGMTCDGCVRSVQRKLLGIRGVMDAVVDLGGASATVNFDSERTSVDQLAAAVRQLGYEVPA